MGAKKAADYRRDLSGLSCVTRQCYCGISLAMRLEHGSPLAQLLSVLALPAQHESIRAKILTVVHLAPLAA